MFKREISLILLCFTETIYALLLLSSVRVVVHLRQIFCVELIRANQSTKCFLLVSFAR